MDAVLKTLVHYSSSAALLAALKPSSAAIPSSHEVDVCLLQLLQLCETCKVTLCGSYMWFVCQTYSSRFIVLWMCVGALIR
jgi:hypothetical protein